MFRVGVNHLAPSGLYCADILKEERMDHRIYGLIQGGAGLLFLVWLSVLVWKWAQRTADMRHELRMRILERFSSEEFVALLQTDGGRKWMADVLTGRPEQAELLSGSLKQAIVFTFVGLAMAAISAMTEWEALAAASALVLAGAAGLWIAAWIVSRRRRRAAGPDGTASPSSAE